MTGVLVFLGGIILYAGVFLFLMMKSIRTEQSFISHIKVKYPAVYADNPHALGGALDGMTTYKKPLKAVIFTRARTDEARKEYKQAKQDGVVKRLKVRAWLLMLSSFALLPIGILILILLIGAPSN